MSGPAWDRCNRLTPFGRIALRAWSRVRDAHFSAGFGHRSRNHSVGAGRMKVSVTRPPCLGTRERS